MVFSLVDRKIVVQDLNDYFESLGSQLDLAFSVTKGTYYPCSVLELSTVFNDLYSKGFIKPDQYFLDAGSGDGRVVALAGLYDLRSFGIEFNEGLYEYSFDKIQDLIDIFSFHVRPEVIHGDFLESQTLKNNNLFFSDFDIIYNFATSPYEILSLIEKESNPGTIYIFQSIDQILRPDHVRFKTIQHYSLKESYQRVSVFQKIK